MCNDNLFLFIIFSLKYHVFKFIVYHDKGLEKYVKEEIHACMLSVSLFLYNLQSVYLTLHHLEYT